MKKLLQKGQGLIEFLLVLPIMVGIIIGFADLTPLVIDLFIAQTAAARGARAAAAWYPDGSSTCLAEATNALGNLGFMAADYELEIDPGCDTNLLATNPQGEEMYVTVTVNYRPPFFSTFGWPPPSSPNVWTFERTSKDQVR